MSLFTFAILLLGTLTAVTIMIGFVIVTFKTIKKDVLNDRDNDLCVWSKIEK